MEGNSPSSDLTSATLSVKGHLSGFDVNVDPSRTSAVTGAYFTIPEWNVVEKVSREPSSVEK